MVTTEDITNLANKASAVTWPFCGIASIFFFMRLFSAYQQKNEARTWEDLVLILSWMFEICQAAFHQKQLNAAKNIDLTRLPQTMPGAIFWSILANDWSFLSIEIPKIGVALMVTRLFWSGRWVKIAIWMLTATINVMAIVAFIFTWLMCDPPAGQWNPWEHPDVKCWPRGIQVTFTLVLGGLSSLFNIALTVYPATIIWGLNMSPWKKISTVLLLGLGLVASAFSIVKLYKVTSLLHNPDQLQMIYDAIEIEMWNRIENDFVLMISLLPYVPGFIKTCKQFTKTNVSSLNQRFSSVEYKPASWFLSQGEHVQLDDHSDIRDTSSESDLVREREIV